MKIPALLQAALEETGMPWEVEAGSKHHKVKLAGRLVAVYPRGKAKEAGKRPLLNTISQVRRAARELQPI